MSNYRPPVIVAKATPIYRAIMLECERRRQRLGWPMWRVDDAAGLQDGHYAKCLHADRPSGRQAQWTTLNLIVTALFRDGFDLELAEKPGPELGPEKCRLEILRCAAPNDRIARRNMMAELGRKGALARAALPKERRLEIAAQAAATRKFNRAQLADSQRAEMLTSAGLPLPP